MARKPAEKTNEPGTQQYTFRIPVDLKAEMEKIALAEDRTLAKQITVAMREHIARWKEKSA
jgi:hypothetical protein